MDPSRVQMWTLQLHITKLRRMYKMATAAKDDDAGNDVSIRQQVYTGFVALVAASPWL
jgi:hypothetical protein